MGLASSDRSAGLKLERVNREYEQLMNRFKLAEKAFEEQAQVSSLKGQLEMERIQAEIRMRGVVTRNVQMRDRWVELTACSQAMNNMEDELEWNEART